MAGEYAPKKKMRNEEHLKFVDQIKAQFQEYGRGPEYLQEQADRRAAEAAEEARRRAKAGR